MILQMKYLINIFNSITNQFKFALLYEGRLKSTTDPNLIFKILERIRRQILLLEAIMVSKGLGDKFGDKHIFLETRREIFAKTLFLKEEFRNIWPPIGTHGQS